MSDNVHRNDIDAIDGAPLNDIDGAETPEELRDFAMEIFDVIRDIRDPEKPETLEELEVLKEESVCVNYLDAQCAKSDPPLYIRVNFTPTVPHCSLATLIGLCIRVKIRSVFDRQHKLDIFVTKGTHKTEDDINKQVNDKERVAAAMENENLKQLVERCIGDGDD